MTEQTILVRDETLEAFVADLFARAGMNDDAARFCAHALVLNNLWGIDSHGVLRAPVYVERVRKRAVNPTPHIKTVRGNAAFEVLDGDDGIGFVVGRAAMLRAIELAECYSVGAVGVIRSNHFGAAALYARMATERGMIGIAMSNVMPNMVAPGGKQTIVGNNPLAIAIPTFGNFPFVLDISLSNVAGGKILLAQQKGEKIPLDWATDREGHPTDDPAKAFAGFLLPLGGHKGLGLAYAVDILCGLITGGAFGDQLKSMYAHPNEPSGTGHFMLALNLDAIITRAEMQARMETFYRRIKAAPMWDANAEMFLPGEIERRTQLQRHAQGISLPRKVYDELVALGNALGTSLTLQT